MGGWYSIYIPWPFPPVWGVADNTKEATKTVGVLLRSSSNDEGLGKKFEILLTLSAPQDVPYVIIKRSGVNFGWKYFIFSLPFTYFHVSRKYFSHLAKKNYSKLSFLA